MFTDLDPILRILHVALGTVGLIFGAAAILLPKFTKRSVWHRWVGRTYAVSMIGMAVISIPLSIVGESVFLLIIGVLTLFWVIGGWVALRRVKSSSAGRKVAPSGRLRWHVTWIGSSYVAAWTAFLVNMRPLGESLPWMIAYSIVPSIIGSFLIGRTITRLVNQRRKNAEQLTAEVS